MKTVRVLLVTVLAIGGAAIISHLSPGSVIRGQGQTSIAGEVRDAAGAPIVGALVKAKKGGITATVLSQEDGSFRFIDLLPGPYDVRVERRGSVAPSQQVTSPSSRRVTFDLKPGPNNRFSVTNRELEELLPESPYKAGVVQCELCHSWSPMAGRVKYRTETWIAGMKRMARRGLAIGSFSEDDFPKVAEYLQANFGPESKLPVDRLPPDPQLEGVSLDIRYVSYDIPTYNAMPHTAFPDGKGHVWFAEYGGGKIGVVDVKTGKMEEFQPPWKPVNPSPHGIATDRFGNAWFTGPTGSLVGRFDPKTKTFKIYPVPPPTTEIAGAQGQGESGLRSTNKPGPHSLVTDDRGMVWLTDLEAGPIIRQLEPETGNFTEYDIGARAPGSVYGIARDPGTGRIWYAGIGMAGWTVGIPEGTEFINEVGYIDPSTGKITRFQMPVANAGPRRLHVDANGVAWFNLFHLAAVGKADPKTGKVQIWNLPGPRDSSPYASGLDDKGRIWTSPYKDDVLYMFDPKTEKFTTFALPTRGNGLRDFYVDENGWMWAGVWGQNQVLSWKFDE